MQFLHWQQAIHLGRKSQGIWHFQCPLSQNTTEGVGCKHQNSPITCTYIHIAMVLPVVGAMGIWESKKRSKFGDTASFVMDSMLLWLLWLTYIKNDTGHPICGTLYLLRDCRLLLGVRGINSDTSRRYSKKINPWLETITEKLSSNNSVWRWPREAVPLKELPECHPYNRTNPLRNSCCPVLLFLPTGRR